MRRLISDFLLFIAAIVFTIAVYVDPKPNAIKQKSKAILVQMKEICAEQIERRKEKV